MYLVYIYLAFRMALASSICRKFQLNPSPLWILAARIHLFQRGLYSKVPSIPNAQIEDSKDHKRWLTYNGHNHTTSKHESSRERNQTVTSYYNQTAIDEASRQNSVRLTPSTIMYSGRSLEDYIMKSAQYLHRYT